MKDGKLDLLPLLEMKAKWRTLGSQIDGQGTGLRLLRVLKPAFKKEDLKCT